MPEFPDIVVGSLPPPDQDFEEEENDPLPPMIVGSLPPPDQIQEHRIQHTHFYPDGKIVHCRCGWQSHLCGTDEDLEVEWMEHL